MPATRSTHKRKSKVKSAKRVYSPSPIKSAPHVKTNRGGKRKRTSAKKNLNNIFYKM